MLQTWKNFWPLYHLHNWELLSQERELKRWLESWNFPAEGRSESFAVEHPMESMTLLMEFPSNEISNEISNRIKDGGPLLPVQKLVFSIKMGPQQKLKLQGQTATLQMEGLPWKNIAIQTSNLTAEGQKKISFKYFIPKPRPEIVVSIEGFVSTFLSQLFFNLGQNVNLLNPVTLVTPNEEAPHWEYLLEIKNKMEKALETRNEGHTSATTQTFPLLMSWQKLVTQTDDQNFGKLAVTYRLVIQAVGIELECHLRPDGQVRIDLWPNLEEEQERKTASPLFAAIFVHHRKQVLGLLEDLLTKLTARATSQI